MGIIFDLDQTLVDSNAVRPLRDSRRWSDVYKGLDGIRVYEGILPLLSDLRTAGIPVCIVTSSPSTYCRKVIEHCQLGIEATVCYHDTSRHKPYPDPIQKGLSLFTTPTSYWVAIGDDPRDVVAAKAAGVYSIAALWGSSDQEKLLASGPDESCLTVADLHASLARRFLK